MAPRPGQCHRAAAPASSLCCQKEDGHLGQLAELAETNPADCFSYISRLICLSLQCHAKKMEKNTWKEEDRGRPLLSTVSCSQDSISCEMAGTLVNSWKE